MHVGQGVLDRLVAADRPAELAALPGVFDSHVQHRLPRADQLRGRGEHTEVECQADVSLTGAALRGDLEESAGRIHRGMPDTGRGVADHTVSGHQHQARELGADGSRHRRRQRHRGDQVPGGERCGSVVLRKQDRRHRNGLGHRTGHTPAAQALAGQREVDRVRTHPAEPLRHRQCGDPEIAQHRPDSATAPGIPLCPSPIRGGHVRYSHRRVDAGGEVPLFGGQAELHDLPSLGRPSSRSAMMFRCTSLVPA